MCFADLPEQLLLAYLVLVIGGEEAVRADTRNAFISGLRGTPIVPLKSLLSSTSIWS
jgi:hypothetical protein